MLKSRAEARVASASMLLSSVGAGVIGFGAGILLARQVGEIGWWVLGLGVAMHVVGMVGKRRVEQLQNYEPRVWERLLYWGCWLMLAAAAAYALAELL